MKKYKFVDLVNIFIKIQIILDLKNKITNYQIKKFKIQLDNIQKNQKMVLKSKNKSFHKSFMKI